LPSSHPCAPPVEELEELALEVAVEELLVVEALLVALLEELVALDVLLVLLVLLALLVEPTLVEEVLPLVVMALVVLVVEDGPPVLLIPLVEVELAETSVACVALDDAAPPDAAELVFPI